MSLTNAIKTVRDVAPTAAGASNVNGTSFDMANYEGIRWIAAVGTIVSGAATALKAQQDTATGMGSAADLLGTEITIADDDDDSLVILDLYRPRERFVRCVFERGTQNSEIDIIIAELYGPRLMPVTKDATVSSQEIHVSPAEGTS